MRAKTMVSGVVSAAMVVTIGAAAIAQGKHGHAQRPSFEEVDTNGDGKITRTDMQDRAATRFGQADMDGDGALSRDEMLARVMVRAEKRVDRMMGRLDANRDGKVSKAEMQQMRDKRMGRMIERMDADGDGALSEEEFAQGHRKGHHGRHGTGHGRMGDGG